MTNKQSQSSRHQFGGEWTSRKLEILRKYLAAYTKALKNQPFAKGYIDVFAGTGYRSVEAAGAPLFEDLAGVEPQQLLDGSAKTALDVEPEFDFYEFVELKKSRVSSLEDLRIEYPSSNITIHQCEANDYISKLVSEDWERRRAVIFVDPYGMELNWSSVDAIAKTGALDMWLLFPLGMGVNRLLKRNGDIPQDWRRKLDLFLGTSDWYDAFYEVRAEPTLFGEDEEYVTKASREVIGKYFIDRLRSVFPGVSESPAVLRNSKGCPLYLLCFAVSSPNDKARSLALRIADHILNGFNENGPRL